uniref:DOMON domain-containing protein n=1 Tax=Syphacia muris TaxID=451379 RepID=A0A0N5A7Z0_9BILA
MPLSTNFWITTELVSVKWDSSCDAINDCADSTLSITQTNIVNNEKVLKQWDFIKYTRSQYRSMLVGYWSDGEPKAITLKAEVLGTDPNYGFQRLCDSSPTVALFPTHRTRNQSAYVFNNGTMVETVDLTGTCFTASVVYSKFINHCPWCTAAKTKGDPEKIEREKVFAGWNVTYWLSTEIILGLLLIGLLLLFMALVMCLLFMCRSSRLKQQPAPLPPPLQATFPNREVENLQWKSQYNAKNNMIFPKGNYFATDFSKDTSFLSLGYNRNNRPLSANSSEGYMSLPQ